MPPIVMVRESTSADTAGILCVLQRKAATGLLSPIAAHKMRGAWAYRDTNFRLGSPFRMRRC